MHPAESWESAETTGAETPAQHALLLLRHALLRLRQALLHLRHVGAAEPRAWSAKDLATSRLVVHDAAQGALDHDVILRPKQLVDLLDRLFKLLFVGFLGILLL